MSGLIRGKIECYVGPAFNRQNMTQSFFKVLYDYFTWHPNYQIIALNYGSTAGPGTLSPGTGTNFYDQSASFGYNAWFVVRQNATATRPFDVYHLFQWGGSTNQAGAANAFGSSPGNPALVNGGTSPFGGNNTYLGHAAAIGIGGTGGTALSPLNGNPWKGTSNANGADTKPTTGQIWGPPSGGGTGIITYPRSNNGLSGGTRSQTQNTGCLVSYSVDTQQQTRIHIVGDDDSFVIAYDGSDNGSYVLCYSGIYNPRSNATVPYPYCVIDTSNAIPWAYSVSSIYGDLAGTSTLQGGIVPVVTASSAPLVLDHYSIVATNADFWPNAGSFPVAQQVYDELDILVGSYEINPTIVAGILGEIDFVREMYGVPIYGLKEDYSRIFLGTTTLLSTKYSIPWDSENRTVPRSGISRNGVYFVAPSLNSNA